MNVPLTGCMQSGETNGKSSPKRLTDLRFTRTVFHKRLLWKTFSVLFSVRRRVLQSLPKVQNHAFLWRSDLWERLKVCLCGMTVRRFPAAFLTALHRRKAPLQEIVKPFRNAPARLIIPTLSGSAEMWFSTALWKTGWFCHPF